MNGKTAFFTVTATLLISSNKLSLAYLFEDTQRSGSFINIPGSALFGHVLSTHYVVSLLMCCHLCLRNKRCISFNFGTIPRDTRFLCELSSSDAKYSPRNLQKQSEFGYFSFLQVSQRKAISLNLNKLGYCRSSFYHFLKLGSIVK